MLSTTNVQFANQNVGTTSSAQPVVLSNSGDRPLNISGIAMNGDFGQTNNCGSAVAAGASCTISVTFEPTGPFVRYGFMQINDNAASSPQGVQLSGTGVGPLLSAGSYLYPFGNQGIGTTSAPERMQITSAGNAPLTISAIGTSGDFAQTNDCNIGGQLAPNASCTVNVTFTPTALGARNGTLTVTYNAAGSPLSLPLTGTGLQHQLLD